MDNKLFLSRIARAIPFSIANTMSFIPFFIYSAVIKIDVNNLSIIFPIVLYYAFYKTSVLITKGIGNVNNAAKLSRISLAIGMIGCLIGMFGSVNTLFWDISGILVGICSSIILPTYQTVNYHERKYNDSNLDIVDYLICVIFIVIMIASIELTLSNFILYTFLILFICIFLAYITMDKLPHFPPKSNKSIFKMGTFSKQDLEVSIILLIIVFSFRLAKQIGYADILIIAAISFTALMLLIIWWKSKNSIQIDLPSWFITMSIFNGMCSAFIFIYSIFYVIVMKNDNTLNSIYIAFAIGLVLAQFVRKSIYKVFNFLSPLSIDIVGMCLGTALLLSNSTFDIGIGILSFFVSANSILLNHTIYNFEGILQDERLITKYRITTIGSIIQHGILILSILIIPFLNQLEFDQILLDYRFKAKDFYMVNSLFFTRVVCIIIILAFGIYILKSTHNKNIYEQDLK